MSDMAYRTPLQSGPRLQVRRTIQRLAVATVLLVALVAVTHLVIRSPDEVCDDARFHTLCATWAQIVGRLGLTTPWRWAESLSQWMPGGVGYAFLVIDSFIALALLRRDSIWIDEHARRLCVRRGGLRLRSHIDRHRLGDILYVEAKQLGQLPLHRLEAVDRSRRARALTSWHVGARHHASLAKSVTEMLVLRW